MNIAYKFPTEPLSVREKIILIAGHRFMWWRRTFKPNADEHDITQMQDAYLAGVDEGRYMEAVSRYTNGVPEWAMTMLWLTTGCALGFAGTLYVFFVSY